MSSRETIEAVQLGKLRNLLAEILPQNRFYAEKLADVGIKEQLASLAEFKSAVPFTTKSELVEDQLHHAPFGSNLTYPLERYTRFSQTSATSGTPMRWLDTGESWAGMLDNWEIVLRSAGVGSGDRVFFAFSFGPFLGFWTAFEAALRRGCLAVPGGGLSSIARLQVIMDNRCSTLCCTPTYAIRLGEVAREQRIDLSKSFVKQIIVAGEPGGSIPAVYQHIESLWPGARVFDHHGMTEVGPVSYECPEQRGLLRIIESAYLPEIVDASGAAVAPGEIGELVLTTLNRAAAPLIRYRTGDLVRQSSYTCRDSAEMLLAGGILGRVDDMISVRGVNVYPGAIEGILRSFDMVAEYRVEVGSDRGMKEIKILIETTDDCDNHDEVRAEIENALKTGLSLRIPVSLVSGGTLPRFEMKAKRWVEID